MAKSMENGATRTVRSGNLSITLDLSKQVLGLEIQEDTGWAGEHRTVEADLYPTLKAIPGGTGFVSASVLAAKAKQFDDGLYAAVELLCQQGTKDFVGKRELLRQVLENLRDLEGATGADAGSLTYCRGFIHAAAGLGGRQLQATPAVEKQSAKIQSAFIETQLRSKPIGFYTWTRELSQIFQQDRLLQEKLNPAVVPILARGLAEGKGTLKPYQAYLSLVEKLTNPFPPEYCDLSDFITNGRITCRYCSFFPPSRSHESELVKQMYGNQPIPRGFSLIYALIDRIRTGAVDLAPGENSGWYDYQVYALEPFVLPEKMPEAQKLHFGQKYKQELVDLFKAALAFTRETHIKQLEIPLAGARAPMPAVKIYPELTVEPTATYYLRRSHAYRFVRELLQSTFGEDTLLKIHRQTVSVGATKPLYDELVDMETLFDGAYRIVCEQIGMQAVPDMKTGGGRDAKAAKALAGEWLRLCADDPDVGTDSRMMVPVFYDIQRNKTKVWVVMGYSKKPLTIWFERKPEARITDGDGNPAQAALEFESMQTFLIYPVSAEVYVNQLLDRDAFRSLCDRNKTPSAILKALRKL